MNNKLNLSECINHVEIVSFKYNKVKSLNELTILSNNLRNFSLVY